MDNFEECLSLSVAEDQKKHIASNAYSLAEAYALSRKAGMYRYPMPSTPMGRW